MQEVKILIKGQQDKYFENWVNSLDTDIRLFFNFSETNCQFEDRLYARAPLTSVSAERSFSALKRIVFDGRCSLSDKSVTSLLNIYFNNRRQ